MRSTHRLAAVALSAGAVLAAAGPAQADILEGPVGFLGSARIHFMSGDDNVRVLYRCSSRLGGFLDMRHLATDFRRFARPRCDGAPRSVLMRVRPFRDMTLDFTQGSLARADVTIFGAPPAPPL
jgi:hypothetical protein